jgi:hypothetical protein
MKTEVLLVINSKGKAFAKVTPVGAVEIIHENEVCTRRIIDLGKDKEEIFFCAFHTSDDDALILYKRIKGIK